MTLTLVLPDGCAHSVDCARSRTVMETIRAAGLPIRAECGGAMACATCHVHVDPASLSRIGAAGDEESDLLDDSDYKSERSRLSCQIKCADLPDGAVLTLQLDAYEG